MFHDSLPQLKSQSTGFLDFIKDILIFYLIFKNFTVPAISQFWWVFSAEG